MFYIQILPPHWSLPNICWKHTPNQVEIGLEHMSLMIALLRMCILNITNGEIEGSFHVDSFQVVDGKIVLVGVTIEINNITIIDLGNITLTNVQLASLLPNSTITYTIRIPSPYSILHNTSSPHGVAAFLGELNAAVFEVT